VQKNTKARRALMDSAATLMADNPGITFMEIAKNAGIGRATLYRHFSSREELIRALSLEAVQAVDKASEGIMEKATSFADAILMSLEAVIPLGNRYYFLTRLPELEDEEVLAHTSRHNAELLYLIKEAQKEGSIDSAVPAKWAATLFDSLVYSTWTLQKLGEISEEQLHQLARDTLIKSLFNKVDFP